VAGQAGAVGMVGVTNDSPDGAGIRLVTIDGVSSTKQALREGSYKLRRPLYLVYPRNGDLKPAVAEFLEYIRSADGQRIIDRF